MLNLKPDLSIRLAGFVKVNLARYLDRHLDQPLLTDRALLLEEAKPPIDRLQPGLSDDAQVQFLKGFYKETCEILEYDKVNDWFDKDEDEPSGKIYALQIEAKRGPTDNSPADTDSSSIVEEDPVKATEKKLRSLTVDESSAAGASATTEGPRSAGALGPPTPDPPV